MREFPGILVGTEKGIVEFVQSGKDWTTKAVHFRGFPVSMLFVDPRDGYWWVGLAHKHWGQKLHYSPDQGKTWNELPVPSFSKDAQPGDPRPALRKIWVMQAADPEKRGTFWFGTEPAAVFRSDNYGRDFRLAEGLWNLPERNDPAKWFGTGGNAPFVHSILVDPVDPSHILIAISCAGIFQSYDNGETWVPTNHGLKAAYLPNPHIEIGHDPHIILACEDFPSIIWQQNHCGIYRSEDGGVHWKDVSGKEGLPYYGFAMAIDHRNPLESWVIPAQSDEERIAPDLIFRVYHTINGGESWEIQNHGLDRYPAFDIVLRQAFDKNGDLLVFGTNNGNLYLSRNRGEVWNCLSTNLAKVNVVKIV